MIKKYVVYGYPNFMCADYSDEIEVKSFEDIPKRKRAFGYYVFERQEEMINGVLLKSEKLNVSGWRYWGTEVLREETSGTLRANMECNGWDRAVRVECGQVFPLVGDDRIITITVFGEEK